MTDFKPGDKVELVEYYATYKPGDTGTVIKGGTESLVRIQMDNPPLSYRGIIVARHRLFKLVSDEFQVGDRVRVKNGSTFTGSTGTITSLGGVFPDVVQVTLDYGGVTNLYAHRLELLQEEHMNYDPCTHERTLSPIEQAQLFLGKKVLVKNKANAHAVFLGKVTEVRQAVDGSNRPGVIAVTVKSILGDHTMGFCFEDQIFEEVE